MDNVLTTKEIAEKLKINLKTVDKWLRTGFLKGAKLGKLWRVRETDFEEFMNNKFENAENKPVLLEPIKEGDLTEEDIRDIEEARKEIKEGKTITLDELKRRLNCVS